MQTTTSHSYSLGELDKEARMGGQGAETSAREVRVIDISHFESRKQEIAEQIWNASIEIGFFQVCGHGIAQADIDAAFSRAEQLFALAPETKAQWPLSRNAGWEHKAQIRPSTRTPDQKESYQVTRPRMQGLWPSEQELRAAKDFLIGSFALRLDSNRKLLGQVAELAWFDLPLNELEDWTARVQALTVEQVRSALQRHVHPERMVTVVLGAQP